MLRKLYEGEAKGFDQIISVNEFVNQTSSIHCVLAVLRNKYFDLAVYQMMDKKIEKNSNESFEHIIDSIYEIHK